MDFSANSTSFLVREWDTSQIPGLVGAILYTVAAAFLQEALHAFLKLQELKLLTRSHRLPVHLGLTGCYVILTAVRCSLVLALLSGNIWVWISLGVGVGSGYFLIRPCLINATSGVSEEGDVIGQDRVRLKTVRKTGQYNIPRIAQHSQGVQESKQNDYYKQTTENNNNNKNNNHNTEDIDKQTQPLLHTAPQREDRTILQQETVSTTFLPSAQPSIQSMSNEERWDYIRETFQKLSRSHLYAGLQERRRIQDQSYLPFQSPRFLSHTQCESSFDASTVDFNDLLNEESYRTPDSAQP